jgi:hypothetical protein
MNTHTAPTEQDTYDALRRVPRTHLEETRESECRMISRNEWRKAEDDIRTEKEMRKVALMRKFSFIFGRTEPITMRLHLSRVDLAELYDPFFKGTGWTTEEYGALIYKEARAVHEYNEVVKHEKGRVILLMYLVVALLSLLSGIVFPTPIVQILAPVAIGFVGGFGVSKLVKHYNSKLKERDSF